MINVYINYNDNTMIKDHIASIKPKVSHYRFEDCPNRRYLEGRLT